MAWDGGRSLVIISALVISCTYCFRMDKPRVLLPYTPTATISTSLHVSDPVGGCFDWRSSRSQYIEVQAIEPSGDGCSDKAVVRTTSKSSSNSSALVHATDQRSGSRLSCEVRVGSISSIEILTTTNLIYVDAVPVLLQVQARDGAGNAFSTLGTLPFEWTFSSDESATEKAVRIVPFSESDWEGSPEVLTLEARGRRGYAVLAEGITTGVTTLTARLDDPHYAGIATHSLSIVVVAQLQLRPSDVIYVPVYSTVPFVVEGYRKTGVERVSMPSSLYYLDVEDSSVCSLEVSSSTVTAVRKGRSDISLFTKGVVTAEQKVSAPVTTIHVTEPESLRFSISGNNWVLLEGERYKVQVTMVDSHSNLMYIADNTKFATSFPQDLLTVHEESENGTYFEVTAVRAGTATLNSSFSSITKDGVEVRVRQKVWGEQRVEVVPPLAIRPSPLVLPLFPSSHSPSFIMLTSEGGSGSVVWSVEDEAVARVETQSGRLHAVALGSTVVTVTDRRNAALSAHAPVVVVEPTEVRIGVSRVEVEEKNTLWLNVQLFAFTDRGERVAVTHCTHADLLVHVDDESILSLSHSDERSVPKEGSGCVAIPLVGRSSGDAKVVITLVGSAGEASVSQHISVYAKLTSKFVHDTLKLATGSTFSWEVTGGPRPWLLDPSAAFSKVTDDSRVVSASIAHSLATVKCSSQQGEVGLLVSVGNGATPSNPLPALSTLTLRVCCAQLTRILLHTQRGAERDAQGEEQSTESPVPACPAHSRSLFVSTSVLVVAEGFGKCVAGGEEVALHSLSSLPFKWSVDADELVKVETVHADKSRVVAVPRGKEGSVTVTAVASHLSASINLRIFDKATASPSSLTLWNDASALGEVQLQGGSGHFLVKSPFIDQLPFHYEMTKHSLKITPKSVGAATLRVHDVCVEDGVVEVKVKVTDVQHIGIHAPPYMEVGSRVDVFLSAVDDEGESFSPHVAHLMDLVLTANSQLVLLEKVTSNQYSMTALSTGQVSLSASGRSSRESKEPLVSVPHSLQIFSPILLFPKQVTLIPESVFQLEVVGGPKPTPPIRFTLNNSKIAQVERNGLIQSTTHLGYSSITGSVHFGEGLVSQDSVVVRVVSLHGVKIAVSSSEVEKGTRILVTAHGLDSSETPFAFGGALYPLHIKWSLNSTDVFRITSPFGEWQREEESNRVTLWLDAVESGAAALTLTVTPHSHSHGHFKGNAHSFTHQIDLRSVDAPSLTSPLLPLGEIILTPGGSLQLQSSWPSASVKYRIPSEYSSLLSVTPKGVITSRGVEGIASVEMVKGERVLLTTVQIVRAASIDVAVSPRIVTDAPLPALPLGASLTLKVLLRDGIGRTIHTSPADNPILFRPHRFDLTHIEGREGNSTLNVRLTGVGETVVKLWLADTPSIFTFVRLSCQDALRPSSNVIVSSDVVCLRSPFTEEESTWLSEEDTILRAVDKSNGVFIAEKGGESTVHLTAAKNKQKLYTTLEVSAPSTATFSPSSPEWISTVDSASFLFPLSVGTNASIHSALSRKLPSAIDCSPSQLATVSVRSPFDCSISFDKKSSLVGSPSAVFHVTSQFVKEIGAYACVVSRQKAAAVSSLHEMEELGVVVSASWVVHHKLVETSTVARLHVAFSVMEEEVVLSSDDAAFLNIRVPAHQWSDMRVASVGEGVHLKELSSPPPHLHTPTKGIKTIQLTMKNSGLRDGEITVESKRTGQKVKIPVRTLGAREALMHKKRVAEGGFVAFLGHLLSENADRLPTLIVVCVLFLLLLLVHQQWRARLVKSGSAAQHNSSAFLSDAPHERSANSSLNWSGSSPQYHSTPTDRDSSSLFNRYSPLNRMYATGDAAESVRRRGGAAY